MKPLENWIKTEQGILVPTSEHAFQANRFSDSTAHRKIAEQRFYNAPNKPVYGDGLLAKEVASAFAELDKTLSERIMNPVYDDELALFGMMLGVVRMKYRLNQDLAERLIATDNELIVEGNDWGDRFWGVDPIGSDNGLNYMGKIHMIIRSELQAAA